MIRDYLASGARARMRAYWRLMRPGHWVKNGFVAAPMLFARADSLTSAVLATAVAVGTFCLLSSAVYAFNDVLDAARDRLHKTKRDRPVAAGQISPRSAVLTAALLAGAALGGALTLVTWPVAAFGLVYLLNNLAYSVALKHRVLADVMSIAIGFVLRLLAGAAAIAVAPSTWLLVCGFSIALFMGFAKRRLEVGQMPIAEVRPTLASYSVAKLDSVMATTAGMTLITYMLYTVAPETVRLHGTSRLIWTVPLVAYGIFRFQFKVQEGAGDGPVQILTQDATFALIVGLWVAAILMIRHFL